jgi:hypothetical protein
MPVSLMLSCLREWEKEEEKKKERKGRACSLAW